MQFIVCSADLCSGFNDVVVDHVRDAGKRASPASFREKKQRSEEVTLDRFAAIRNHYRMSKGKQARFHIKNSETLIKKGMMDYCLTGGFGHSVMGDAYLTDRRFFFGAEIKRTGEYISFELSLTEVDAVEKVGIPVLTRSLSIIAGGRRYRLNVFPMQGWIKAIRRAAEIAREKIQSP